MSAKHQIVVMHLDDCKAAVVPGSIGSYDKTLWMAQHHAGKEADYLSCVIRQDDTWLISVGSIAAELRRDDRSYVFWIEQVQDS